MRPFVILLMLASAGGWWNEWWGRFSRPGNSQTLVRRGVAAYAKKQYDAAAEQFARANQLRPSARAQLDHATSLIAGGHREQASEELERLMKNPQLKPDALYNRGTGALNAKDYSAAVQDLKESLRVRPSDPQAKHNLELAMAKQREEEKQKEQQKQQNSGGKGQKPQEDRIPHPQQNQQAGSGSSETDAVLRAVQQQESEELSRLNRQRLEPSRVGW